MDVLASLEHNMLNTGLAVWHPDERLGLGMFDNLKGVQCLNNCI